MSTFAVLKQNVSLELGLDETAAGDEDTLLGRRLNQGVRQVLLDTGCTVVSGEMALVAGQDDYDLATAIWQPFTPLAVKNLINSDGAPLQRVSVEEMHALRRGENSIGTNVHRYAVDGSNLLMLYPAPGATPTMTAYFVPKPTEMSSDSHDPSAATYGGIPVEYHDLIEHWACFRMAMYDDDQSSGNGQLYKQFYEEGVIRARADIRKRGGRTLGPVRPGRRARAPWNPGQDIWRG